MYHSPEWLKWNRKVHASAKRLDVDHEELSRYARTAFHIDSMKNLTISDLKKINKGLNREYNKSKMANSSQIRKVWKLGYRILKKDSKWISDFVFRQTGRYCDVKLLHSADINKVINGMNQIAIEKGLIKP